MRPNRLDETADDESTDWRALGGEEIWGIFWVWPAERFDELSNGAKLGRAGDCAIVLEGSNVSREHAVIEQRGPIWGIRDLGSKNGVFVNCQRREQSALGPQDTVRVGDWVGIVCLMPAERAGGELFFELDSDFVLSAPTFHKLSHVEGLARSELAVVIEGQTGTGKEALVRWIHGRSGRRGPLIAINCAALPEGLAESQLFGHKKGAFTGATEAALGYMAAAEGGTLLLDEIVDLPLSVQSKLLRALEERAVVPVGSSHARPVDFRLIATAQKPLQPLVETGAFRADLYARLSGVELSLPVLRKRRQEIVRLLQSFMRREVDPVPRLDCRLIERLCSYAWPYNVRELRQLARLLASCSRQACTIADLPDRFVRAPQAVEVSDDSPADDSTAGRYHRWLSRHAGELARLKATLKECGGNVSEAARSARIPRHRARRLLAAESRLSAMSRRASNDS